MDTQNPSAPPRAQSAPADKPARSRHHTGGVIHENTRHTTRFTVIGNHLTQHKELSLLAIGLGCHLQSLPTGAPADIKSLTARFKEGATPSPPPSANWRPTATCAGNASAPPPAGSSPAPSPATNPDSAAAPPTPAAPHHPGPRTGPNPAPAQGPPRRPPAHPSRRPGPPPAGHRPPHRPPPPRPPPPPLRHRHRAPGPGVAAWLEREVTPTAVRHALTTDLPDTPSAAPQPFSPTASQPNSHPHPLPHPGHHPTPAATNSAPATPATAPSAPRTQKPTAATAARQPPRLPREHGTAPDR